MKPTQKKPLHKRPFPPGFCAKLQRLTHIATPTMSALLNGKRRPTPKQAALLEYILRAEGYNITRDDMLYSRKGTPLLRTGGKQNV